MRYVLAVFCVVIGLLVSLWTEPVLHATTLFLAAVVIAAWFGGLGPGLLAAVLSTLAVEYYFTPPFYSWRPGIGQIPRLLVFALLALFSGWGSAARKRAEAALQKAHDELEVRVQERTTELRQTNLQLHEEIDERRRVEEALRRQANLLELTHDAIIVWEFPRRIIFWNRGAEQLYGFPRQEAVGRVAHELLHTEHPIPTHEFEAALKRTGQWAGELTHTTRDGRKILVESRHVLMTEVDGRQLVLETNHDITERKRTEQALEDLAGKLIHAQEEERSRIGRELHDHISQTLGVLSIKIDQLRADPATAQAGIEKGLDELRARSSEITADVHRLSHRLHSSTLDYLGLVPALQKLVAEFSERHDISIDFAHAPLPAPLPSLVAQCLFRIAEESLTNIAKHSGARSAQVHVTGGADGIHLTVEDAGAGFDPARLESKAGLGLVSMQERVRLVHGTIRVDSAPSRGTTINVWVPATSLQTSDRGEGVRSP